MNRMILLGCVLAIGLLAGCTNYPMEEKIQYGNAWHVSLSEAPRTYPPMVSRPMRVEVSLEEAWQMPIDLDYRFVWFTRTGSPARGSVAPSASGGWRTVRVESGQSVILRGSAVEIDAVDWILELRRAKG